jgi:hypothetical protein
LPLSVDKVNAEEMQDQRAKYKIRKRAFMRNGLKFGLILHIRLHAQRSREDKLAYRSAEPGEEGVERLYLSLTAIFHDVYNQNISESVGLAENGPLADVGHSLMVYVNYHVPSIALRLKRLSCTQSLK